VRIAEFITGVRAVYRRCYDTDIRPALRQPPDKWGLKFGIDDGVLLKLRMEGREEYIGRPINIACRLQGLVTDGDMRDGCRALISCRTYDKIGHALSDFSPIETRRNLRNIAGEGGFRCYRLAIGPNSCQQATQPIQEEATPHRSSPRDKHIRIDQRVKEKKLRNYLDALEGVNQHLLEALKKCLELLAEVESNSPPDRAGWQAILGDMRSIIQAGEKVSVGRTLH
jgi:hypothetical protein